MSTIQNSLPTQHLGGVQTQPSKLDQFVQSARNFFGRAVEWARTLTDRSASHVTTAQQTPPTPTAYTRAQVEKAIPSSRVAFDALALLRQPGNAPPTMVEACRVGLVSVREAAKLLTGDIPMGGPEWTQARDTLLSSQTKLSSQLSVLDTLVSQNPGNDSLRQVRDGVREATQQVTARLNYLNNFEGSHALSQVKVAEAKLGWAASAMQVINDKIAELESRDPAPDTEPLKKLLVKIGNEASQALNDADPTVTVHDGGNLKSASLDLAKQISGALKEMGVSSKPKDLAKEVHAKHVEVLNNRDWDPIHKDVQFVHDGVPHTYKSEIDPAAHIATLKTAYNGKGICCQARGEANHSVNLATTVLKNDRGDVVFQGVRSGIIGAYGIKDPQARQDANFRRADELLLGVVGSRTDLLALAMNHKEGDPPIELDMTSINLLTPDTGRWLFGGKDKGGTDRAITRDQLKTLQAIDGTVRELSFVDDTGKSHTIKVKPNVAAFSFGVNEGATRDGFKAGMMYYAPGGGKGSFDNVKADNALAMNKLIGDPLAETSALDENSKIGKFLSDPTKSAADKQIVMELREQIRTMWNNDDFMVHGGDPHKMVSRLSVLTHLLGETPCFNCKSGKDRTGTLDVEAKFLATRIAFNKERAISQGIDPTTISLVPEPGPLSVEEQAMFRQFAISTGNLEVQEYNTGIGGYKTGAQHALQARLGDKESVSRFIGGAKHVDA